MARPSKLQDLINTVTVDVSEHPNDLTRYYAESLGISRVAAANYVSQLESDGWISRSGPKNRPVFSPGYKRRIANLYSLQGLEDDVAWLRDARKYLNLSANVQNIAMYGFTEMLNNAIDHSGGTEVFVMVEQDQIALEIFISDDGIGLFKKITDELKLTDMRLAIYELSKGKLTTDPARHTGQGIFFTSRMFDDFIVIANDLEFNHEGKSGRELIDDCTILRSEPGTTVYMRVRLDCERTANDVFDRFTNAPDDFDFSKTIVPMRLAQLSSEQLVSRSQAKRLIARFDQFKMIVLDFDGIDEIGQAFADELFRVVANSHPGIELIPKNMSRQVERMWLRAVAPRS